MTTTYPGVWNNSELQYEFPMLKKVIIRGNNKQCVIYWQIIVKLYNAQDKLVKPPPQKGYYAVYYSISGDEGGVEKVSSPIYVHQGKQKRDLFEQAVSQANSLYKKKEKNYVQQSLYKPMLSQIYSVKRIKLDKDRWFLQAKIDGVRALFHNGVLYSRELNIFPGKQYITDELSAVVPSDFILDGELYIHHTPLQLINSYARTSDDETKLYYNIFDGFSLSSPELTFEERWNRVKSIIVTSSPYIQLVDTYEIHNITEIDEYLQKYMDDDYEGVILRNNSVPYEIGKRSYSLLKYKKFQTEEFAIIDVVSGTGKYTDYPVFVLSADLREKKTRWDEKDWEESSQRTFSAIYSCGDLEEGKKLYKELVKNNKKLFYEKYFLAPATVKFLSYTKDLIPRHPILIALLVV